jgi:Amino acid permease
MGAFATTMFAGITVLAIVAHVHIAQSPGDLIGAPAGMGQRTAIGQIGLATFGQTLPFYLLQAFTAAILVLAANTAFNGFPVLASLLGRDGHLPNQLAHRGDRLVFSNGIVLLTRVSALLIVAFNAQVNRLIQLYILGVFLSFTLSQAGMVRHWQRMPDPRAVRRKQVLNATGAVVTGLLFAIVLVTKFAEGAWIVVLAAPILFATMKGIAMHYREVGRELAPTASGIALPARVHAVVLVSNLQAPTLRALAFAQATSPASLRAVKVTDEDVDEPLADEWRERGVPVHGTAAAQARAQPGAAAASHHGARDGLQTRSLMRASALRRRVPRLVQVELGAARQPDRGDETPALVAHLARELGTALLELGHGRLYVVAHQVELLRTALLGRVERRLGRRQPEDEPAAAGVDRREPQHVAEERAVGVGVA